MIRNLSPCVTFKLLFQVHQNEVTCITESPFSEKVFATGGVDGRFCVHRLITNDSSTASTQDIHLLMEYEMPRKHPDTGIYRFTDETYQSFLIEQCKKGENTYLTCDGNRNSIRCCVHLPKGYGIGFIVGTAGGVLSIFKPSPSRWIAFEVSY